MANIQLAPAENIGSDTISVLLLTDPSAVFDTVDNLILLRKLEHYGIKEAECLPFQSILSNRQQYVDLDGDCYELTPTGDYSVVQGSKMANI